MNVREIKRV